MTSISAGNGLPDARDATDALFVISSLGLGGSETKTVRLAETLAGRGRTVGIVSLGGSVELAGRVSGGVRLWLLRRKHRLSFRTLHRMRNILREHRPSAVFAVDLFSAFYVVFARLLSPGSTFRLMALVNTSSFVRRRDAFFMTGYRHVLRAVDEVIFGSQRQMQEWKQRHGLQLGTASVIYNGVAVDQFTNDAVATSAQQIRNTLGIDGKTFVILSVGRLAREKNHVCLVRVVRNLVRSGVDAELVIVGDGPMRPVIEAEARELGVPDRLRLPGQATDVRPYMKMADVFVLPSTAVETFSNAALEAMSCGLPVVLSNLGGAAEMVEAGISGYIFEPDDEGALTSDIAGLSRNALIRRRIGAKARERVLQYFTWDRMVDQYEFRIPSHSQSVGQQSVP